MLIYILVQGGRGCGKAGTAGIAALGVWMGMGRGRGMGLGTLLCLRAVLKLDGTDEIERLNGDCVLDDMTINLCMRDKIG